VFLVRDANGGVALIILPVRGSGYQSPPHGFLALAGDTSTVVAPTFYEQGDTPGMGARIQDPSWKALWPGKQVYDDTGALRIGNRYFVATTDMHLMRKYPGPGWCRPPLCPSYGRRLPRQIRFPQTRQ
jgi:Na(+)-translocating NADH:ubiquinone oxidoreductase C subunit